MSTVNLWVCCTCFELTSAGKGMQRCGCEKYQAYPGIDCPNGYHLCYMCAALAVGGTSRYSWNACKTCLNFNRELASSSGYALPLGRHSIMNGIAVPLGAKKELQNIAIHKLLDSINKAEEIKNWGKLEAWTLHRTVEEWKVRSRISIRMWETKFKLDEIDANHRSTNACKRFLEP